MLLSGPTGLYPVDDHPRATAANLIGLITDESLSLTRAAMILWTRSRVVRISVLSWFPTGAAIDLQECGFKSRTALLRDRSRSGTRVSVCPVSDNDYEQDSSSD